MSQHKYNSQQMLFVKNVPQSSAVRIASLYTKYKPLEAKNLYPHARITTLLIALPSICATEEPLRRTEGLRIGNIVISVERYNPRQSVAARRDARKRRDNYSDNRTNYNGDEDGSFDDGDDHNGYDGYDSHEEAQVEEHTRKTPKLITKQHVPDAFTPPPRTRRVSESGGISWANVAGGTQPEQCSLSPAPPAKVDSPQRHFDETGSLPSFDHDAQPEDATYHAHTPVNDDRRNTLLPPPGIQARAIAVAARQPVPQIAITPATASSGPLRVFPHPSSTSILSYNYFSSAPGGRTASRTKQARTVESPRVNGDSSQHTRATDAQQIQRGMLSTPTDTTQFIRRRHCADCAFCNLRAQSQWRAFSHAEY